MEMELYHKHHTVSYGKPSPISVPCFSWGDPSR